MKKTLSEASNEEKVKSYQRITIVGFVLILIFGIIMLLLDIHR